MQLGGLKKQILLGLAMFVVGFTTAAAVGYHRLKQKPAPVTAENVLGTTVDTGSATSTQSSAEGQSPIQNPNPVPTPVGTPTPVGAPKPVPLPAAQAPALPKPKPKIDYCKQFKEELAKTQDGIELKFQTDSALAKTEFDSQQAAVTSSLGELAKKRNAAVNDYLTAIAVATAKFNNSAKGAPDYQAYEQEQGAALALHNHAISEITTQEATANQQKADSQSKYDSLVKTFEDQKSQALSEAQGKFQTQAAGLVCS